MSNIIKKENEYNLNLVANFEKKKFYFDTKHLKRV